MSAFATIALLLFTTSVAFADPADTAFEAMNKPAAQCAKEAAQEIKDFLKTELKAVRAACKDLRDCKKTARKESKKCKQGCKGLKGAELRQCKKDCRKDKRADKKSCREAFKTPECKKARKTFAGKTFKGLLRLAKIKECREALSNLSQLQ